MEIPKFIKGVAKYFTYASDSGETTPTTQADLQELMKNNNTILECLVDGLWQPDKEMQLGQIVRSPNMPANTVAKVTSVGVTGTTEPEWPETVEATVSDGSVTFTMVTNIINSYTKTEIDAKMEDKADLVEGKVPTDQLPEMDYVPKTGDTTIKGKLSVESPAEDSNNNEVATTSWVKTLIEKYIIDNILSICGVTYLLEQNGYVRIGILRNFTVQWGIGNPDANCDIFYPIPMTSTFTVLPVDSGMEVFDIRHTHFVQPLSFGTRGFRVTEIFASGSLIVPREDQYISWVALGTTI